MRGDADVGRDDAGELLGQRGSDVLSPGDRLPHGGRQLVGRAVLGDVAARAQPQAAHRELLLGIRAQHQRGHRGIHALDLLEQRQAVPSLQVQVDERDVPPLLAGELQRLGGGACVAELRIAERLAEDLVEPAPDDRVIVDDQEARHGAAPAER